MLPWLIITLSSGSAVVPPGVPDLLFASDILVEPASMASGVLVTSVGSGDVLVESSSPTSGVKVN
jgi:hypothetical protein